MGFPWAHDRSLIGASNHHLYLCYLDHTVFTIFACAVKICLLFNSFQWPAWSGLKTWFNWDLVWAWRNWSSYTLWLCTFNYTNWSLFVDYLLLSIVWDVSKLFHLICICELYYVVNLHSYLPISKWHSTLSSFIFYLKPSLMFIWWENEIFSWSRSVKLNIHFDY